MESGSRGDRKRCKITLQLTSWCYNTDGAAERSGVKSVKGFRAGGRRREYEEGDCSGVDEDRAMGETLQHIHPHYLKSVLINSYESLFSNK